MNGVLGRSFPKHESPAGSGAFPAPSRPGDPFWNQAFSTLPESPGMGEGDMATRTVA